MIAKTFKVVTGAWLTNVLVLTTAFFKHSYAKYHCLWSEEGWLDMIHVSCVSKLILSIALVALFCAKVSRDESS